MKKEFAKRASLLTSVALAASLMGGCQGMPQKGNAAAVGAVVGAVAGGRHKGAAALAGAAAGWALGSNCKGQMKTYGTRSFNGNNFGTWHGHQNYRDNCTYYRDSSQGQQGLPARLLK